MKMKIEFLQKSNIETRIFAFYNRVVGYRNTSRGIAMLHSIIELTIKKMVATKSKTSQAI